MVVLHLIAIEKYKILKYNIYYIMVKHISKEDANSLAYCDFLKAVESQEKWRQKQIDIFYKSGRPIFGKYVNGKLVKNLIYNLK